MLCSKIESGASGQDPIWMKIYFVKGNNLKGSMPWYTIKMLIVLWYKGASVHPKLAAKFGYIVPKLLVLEKAGEGN